MKKNIIQRTLALVLTIAALAMTQAALAISTFTIEPEGNGNTFKIKRSDTSKAETVKYYTISLSALAGVHFTKTDGEYTFPVGTDSYSVTVPETAVNYIAAKYLYYSGSGHTYRFLVADKNGFEYAHLDRTLTYDGYALTNDSPFGVKDVVIQSAEYTADDDGYDVNGYKSVSSSDYFNNAAPKGYFSAIGAQLRMTLSFEAKENDDAFEYLQLLVDNTSTCDNRSDCKDKDPGNINLSKYMAGFEMNTDAKDDTYRSYTFPVLSAGDNEGATNPWNHGTEWPLHKQKFNGNRATDGRIIIPTDFSTLVLRLNASGKSGSDEWAAKNVKAHIQAVDNTAPTLESITLAGGTYVCKTSCYITLAFSEPVIVTGTPELSTSCGSLAYLSGSGTNVLTFYRKELDGGGTALTVSSLMNVNQVSDLAGNAFSGTVSKSFSSVSVQEITLFDDYVKFIDLAGSYPVSSTPAEPKPRIGVYCGAEYRPLSLNSSYTRTYSNNTENDIVPGTGIITITGIGIYTGTVSAEFNTRWATSSVAFKKNHDGPSITMTDQTFTYNQSQALKANSMTRSGYAFNGWNTEANGSGTAYADKQELTNPSSTGTFTNGATLTLYAQWTPITYTLRLHHNDGTDAYTDMVMTYDQSDNIQSISRTGYTFAGWSTTADGAVVYTNGQEVSNLTATNGAIIDLYAKWNPITYTLRLHHNDGTEAYTDMAMTYDQPKNIQNIQSIPRTGYACLGWSTSANGDVVYTARQLVSNLTVTDGAIIDLYAKWGTDVWGVTQGKDGSSAEKAYIITTPAGLDLLAMNVNGTDGYTANNFSGKYFKLGADITYLHTTDWDDATSRENNFTAIGGYGHNFQGSFDGDGHTISGIRIYKSGSDEYVDGYQGLFGCTFDGSVLNVTLSDTRITGYLFVGGIIGERNYGQFNNCHVTNTVAIHAVVNDSRNHGGIVGYNIDNGIHKISGCTSAATISIADGLTGCIKYGGIVGQNDRGTIENCRTVGATVNGNDNVGAIVGNDGNGTYTSNYYLGCTVNGTANATNVGIGSGDRDGVRSVHALTLADGITASGQSVTISGVTYYASNTTVTLTYSGSSETFTMPDCDVIPLLNGFDNSSVISSHDGETVNVVLAGRTLYKDGSWNTLCLPFNLDVLSDIKNNEENPLHGATIMNFDTDHWFDANGSDVVDEYAEGCHSSGQIENGNLYLYFFKAMEGNDGFSSNIAAGEPVLVKWDGDGTNNIVNPVFTGVTISKDTGWMNRTTYEGSDDYTHDGNVTFKSTYAPITFDAADRSVLFMGRNNTLFYPEAGASIGAFRAYFQLNGISATDLPAGNVKMFFGEGDDTDGLTPNPSPKREGSAGAWYTIDGRRVSGKPTQKGIYVNNGRKVVIK